MVLKYLWAFCVGLVFLYIQLLVMPSIAIGQIIPNLLFAWLLFNIWSKQLNIAAVTGFLIGLLYDATLPGTFGMNALIFVLLCVGVDMFRKPFEVDSVIAKVLTLIIGNIIYSSIQHLIMGLSYGFDSKLFQLVFFSFLYNLLFSFVVFWLMTFLSKLRIYITND